MRQRKPICTPCFKQGKHIFPETIAESKYDRTLKCGTCGHISTTRLVPAAGTPQPVLEQPVLTEERFPAPASEDIFAVWENAGREKMEGR